MPQFRPGLFQRSGQPQARGGLTNTARHPARAGAWPRSLTDAPWDHAGCEMPPQTPPTQPGLLRGVLSVSGSQPGLQHCGSCATRRGQGTGLRPALRCRSAFCQQLGCTQAQHMPAPLGPATCRMALSPWVTHGGGAGCWHMLMFPSTSRVITSHELSQRNEASAACCRTKLWFQQGAGQSLQLAAGPLCAAPNPPGSAWPTSQLCSGTPFHFDLALSDPGFSKNQKQECGCCSDRRETRRPLLPPSPLTLYRKNWLQTSSRPPPALFLCRDRWQGRGHVLTPLLLGTSRTAMGSATTLLCQDAETRHSTLG